MEALETHLTFMSNSGKIVIKHISYPAVGRNQIFSLTKEGLLQIVVDGSHEDAHKAVVHSRD